MQDFGYYKIRQKIKNDKKIAESKYKRTCPWCCRDYIDDEDVTELCPYCGEEQDEL